MLFRTTAELGLSWALEPEAVFGVGSTEVFSADNENSVVLCFERLILAESGSV